MILGFDWSEMDNFRAEEAIAGNSRALAALRELIIYPFLYANECKKLGLNVFSSLIAFLILNYLY